MFDESIKDIEYIIGAELDKGYIIVDKAHERTVTLKVDSVKYAPVFSSFDGAKGAFRMLKFFRSVGNSDDYVIRFLDKDRLSRLREVVTVTHMDGATIKV